MVLARTEYSGEDGIVEIDVEAGSTEEAMDVLDVVSEAVEEEFGFEQYR